MLKARKGSWCMRCHQVTDVVIRVNSGLPDSTDNEEFPTWTTDYLEPMANIDGLIGDHDPIQQEPAAPSTMGRAALKRQKFLVTTVRVSDPIKWKRGAKIIRLITTYEAVRSSMEESPEFGNEDFSSPEPDAMDAIPDVPANPESPDDVDMPPPPPPLLRFIPYREPPRPPPPPPPRRIPPPPPPPPKRTAVKTFSRPQT